MIVCAIESFLLAHRGHKETQEKQGRLVKEVQLEPLVSLDQEDLKELR